MGRINRLDEHLSNMIAAGEVVERPSGIVKELVENSIDASASHIDIYIMQGGIESIQIVDDGIGMDAQDAVLALSLIHILNSNTFQASIQYAIGHYLIYRSYLKTALEIYEDVHLLMFFNQELPLDTIHILLSLIHI